MAPECPTCETRLRRGKCPECGWQPLKVVDKSPVQVWTGLPPYTKPKDDDICGLLLEDGSGWCTATARDHIEEFRRLVSRPDTLLSRPSQREAARTVTPTEAQLEARRQFLAQQAAQIRQQLTDDTVPF